MKAILASCIALLATTSLWAQNWTLNTQQSHLVFTSIKNSNIAENHFFKSFNGQVTNNHKVVVNVDLSSVETAIDIRNERMKEHLFKVNEFSTASIELSLPKDFINSLKKGAPVQITQKFALSLHGKKNQLSGEFKVTKLTDSSVQVVNIEPINIQAAQFDLIGGILKLQQLAKLNSIDAVVPVNLFFVFDAQ